MSRVFWDTNLFIYLFEDYGPLSKAVVRLRSKMLDRGDQLLTSTLTLGEILVKPIERHDSELCRRIRPRARRSANSERHSSQGYDELDALNALAL